MNTLYALRPDQISARDLSEDGREFRRFLACLRDAYQTQEADVKYPKHLRKATLERLLDKAFIERLNQILN